MSVPGSGVGAAGIATYPGSSSVGTRGGPIAYGSNFAAVARRSATYVDKILHGAKPADLPVEQPTRFYLIVNPKTAETLGLTIPPALLQRADQVIE